MEFYFGLYDCYIIIRYLVCWFQQIDVVVLGLLGKMVGVVVVMVIIYKVLLEILEIQVDFELKVLGNFGEKWICLLKL